MHNLIDREALKREVRDVVFQVADTPLSNDPASKLIFKMGELLAKKIDDAPGVDAEPVRHGTWETVREKLWNLDFEVPIGVKCEFCGNEEPEPTNYCSFCGAKMMDGDTGG